MVSKGTYEKQDNNSYVLTDESGNKTLVILLHNKFYYYDAEASKMITFVTDGSGKPTYIEYES